MKALITGHKGFIGKTLNQMLEEKGWDVYGIDLKDSRDVATPGQLDDWKLSTDDVLFHLAAHPVAVSPNTIDSMYAVIDYVDRTGCQLVFASSAAVYKAHSSVYAAQKTLCETLIRENLEPEQYTILRLFNVIGHDGPGVVDRFVRSYVEAGPLVVNGNGQQRRDFVHVNDVCRAMIKAAELDIAGICDVGTGRSYSINQVLEFFPGANIERKLSDDVGILNSVANLDSVNVNFPWMPEESNLEDYIELEISKYDIT